MSNLRPQPSLTKSTLSSLGWQYTSVFIQAVLQLVVLAVLARMLLPKDFGLVGIALIFVGLAQLLSKLGVGPAIIQREQLKAAHIRTGFTLSILFGFVVFGILWASAPLVAAFFQNNEVTNILRVISLTFVLAGFGTVAEAILRRNLQFARLMWVDVGAYTFGYVLIGIAMAWLGFGAWALVGAHLGRSLMKSILVLVSQRHPIMPQWSKREMQEILYYGGGITLSRLFAYAAGQGDYFVVGRVMGAGALGLYTRAYHIMRIPSVYIGQALDNVLFPVMTKIQNEQQRLKEAYLTGTAMLSLLNVPVSALMIITAPELINLLMGPNWSEAILPFQILSFGVLPSVAYKIDDSVIKARGEVYRRSARNVLYAVAVILGSVIGLQWGLPGVATGVLLATYLNYFLAAGMSLEMLNCSRVRFMRSHIPGLLLTVITAIPAISTRLFLLSNGLPFWLVLMATVLVSLLCLAGFVLVQPQILGTYGIHGLNMVFRSLPANLVPKFVWHWLRTKKVLI